MPSSTTKKKNLLQILILLIAVVVIVVASVVFQNWWNNRPGLEPADITIRATVGDQVVEVSPYTIAELGMEVKEYEITSLSVGENDTVKLDLPEEIYDHDWMLLSIYDDPAANDEKYYRAHEQTTVEIAGSANPTSDINTRPRLAIIEVTSVLIGHDAHGAEAPYTVTWSIGTKYAESITFDDSGSEDSQSADSAATN
ncbi:DUF2771 domain-containing protein [Corynebacterium kutscheri]|uniref:DUF2771 family protein n=1 Tax=Corynebacterium kutscheri TaxID=35755 RepID=A0A0F6TEC2_9CORY|nr:DUF2771 domain-containing protein [Corynebacterium kutscheri]AKE41889.1 Protein of unknown function (DUF2771) [Corynebacterium kutscheri]VEH10217.1 putative secreted protein [Corynebacterium kutscheri]